MGSEQLHAKLYGPQEIKGLAYGMAGEFYNYDMSKEVIPAHLSGQKYNLKDK